MAPQTQQTMYQKIKSEIRMIKQYGSDFREEHLRCQEHKGHKKFILGSSAENFATYVDKLTGRTARPTPTATTGQQAAGAQPIIQIYNQTPQAHQPTQYEQLQAQQVHQAYLNAITHMGENETARHSATLQAMSDNAKTLEQALYHVQQMRDADASLLTRSYETIERNFQAALDKVSEQAKESSDKMLTGILESYQRNEEKRMLFIQDTAKKLDDQTSKYLEKIDSQYKSALQSLNEQKVASDQLVKDIVYQLTSGKKGAKRTYTPRKPRVTLSEIKEKIEHIEQTTDETKAKVDKL